MSTYTERAKKALALAEEEAKRFAHPYLGTEHLLLGVTGVEQGVAGKALRTLGVDLPRLRETMMFVIGRGDGPVLDDPPPTPRAGRALAAAAEEAAALGHHYIGTEHLLLGLLRRDDYEDEDEDEPSAAVRLLASLQIDRYAARTRVAQMLSPESGVARTRDHVVTCRVDDRVLGALDALVEAGVYTTRSEAAARLLLAGLEANRPLLEKVDAAVAQIRRVRDETRTLTRDWAEAAVPLPARRDDADAAGGRDDPDDAAER